MKAKIVKSFARIHKDNLINFGIVPLVFADPTDFDAIDKNDTVSISGLRKAIAEGASEIPVRINDKQIKTRLEVSDRQRRILLAGGILNLARQ